MGGIAGIQGRSGGAPPDVRALEAMVAALAPRGPDDSAVEVHGQTALGFRRLAILDLAGGRQPIANEDGRVVAVLNGEIYDHGALRDELRAAGHVFRTRSDAEVLVHGWEEWGEALPARLTGMFAFAVLDLRGSRSGSGGGATLFLARDRFGQKPLFTAETSAGFVFASEMKAMRRHPAVSSEIDLGALRRYLVFGATPGAHSILEGVRKLAPGASATVRDGRVVSERRFHDLAYSPKLAPTDADAAAELWTRLRRSVAMQAAADVPVGVFLSGGLDSAAIVAALREESPSGRIVTFSMGFDDPSFDESGPAARVARHFGTEHHAARFGRRELHEAIAALPRLLDEPFSDSSILPTYVISRFAREHVTVALGGDGGDELLAGYDTFAGHAWARRWNALVPAAVERGLAVPFARALPLSRRNMSFDFRLRQFLRGARAPVEHRTWSWMASFLPAELPSILTADSLRGTDDLFAELTGLDAEVAGEHPVDRQIHQMIRTYLADDILTKVDRASMAASLEVRAPFLDHDLAEWICRLPVEMKFRGGTRKWLLRRALRGRIPDDILARRKHGFGIPTSEWLWTELADWAAATLDDLGRDLGHVVRIDRARTLFDEHRSGRADHRRPLWTLLCLGVWAASRR